MLPFWDNLTSPFPPNVKEGDPVKQGDVIGKIDSTGGSDGHHLHFEIREKDTPVKDLQWGRICKVNFVDA